MFCKNVAQGRNGVIHYIFTILFTVLGYFLGQVPMLLAFNYQMNRHNDIGKNALLKFQENPDFSLFHISSNGGLFLMMMIFIFAFVALALSVKYIHRRSVVSLISNTMKIDWKRILWSTGFWFLLLFIVELLTLVIYPERYTFRKPDSSFFVLLLICIFILPIQTTFEEVFTRGYIFQAVSYNSKSIFWGLIVSIVVFAFMHGMNPETVKYGFWPMMSYYISAAVLLGLIVVFDDRLELAIGVHTATNMFGALIVTYEGAAMQTDSLFLNSKISPIVLALEIIVLGVIFLLFASRKYHWNIKSIDWNCKN
ncbi:MAG TPA: CPBP family intramembrane metalloprotease [Bacteroidetes bacterium]|nr:CPBP family intramembrane metalloprotease [Bacteroidota bacterium]